MKVIVAGKKAQLTEVQQNMWVYVAAISYEEHLKNKMPMPAAREKSMKEADAYVALMIERSSG